ncbi:PEP-CTERM sorting domain-containing protein [Nostoc sp.]|uniref:PEP-CTERM sorting domain-containing protein n=1 Tax=Nostoc sp. TaxID=1180 RepID=UPI0035940885
MINTKNFTKKLVKTTTLTAFVACSLGAGIANASIISFSSLSGNNFDSFTGTTEGNFTVTPTEGDWFEGQVFGNPTPSIFTIPISQLTTSSINVTENTNKLFTFASVDLTSNAARGGEFSIQGFLNSQLVLSTTGTIDLNNSFTTILSTDSQQILDSLQIILTPALEVSSLNVDNINVTTAVPEPSNSGLLFGLGILSTLALRRKKLANTVKA